MNSMNAWFGKELRRELVKLMMESSGPKNRTNSANSERLSLDSLDVDRKDDSAELYDQVDWAQNLK